MPGTYEKLIRRTLFSLKAETAHELGMKALQIGLRSAVGRRIAEKHFRHDGAVVEQFGLRFSNPIGIAAGFDKNGVVSGPLSALGFGFIETGTVTFRPQPGNPRPRMFRLPLDKALINRLGFNNLGAAQLAEQLRERPQNCIIGINIGKNKDVPNGEAVENYLACLDVIHGSADYIAVNISSPNTPNLRELQSPENLETLLAALQKRNRELGSKPLLVKIAPDLREAELEAIVDVCRSYAIDGIIATNTTIRRDGLETPGDVLEKIGAGGLSGAPVRKMATDIIARIYRLSAGKLPIIGVGGVFTGADAFEKIAAGASLVQAYTGFIYRGPGFARDVNNELRQVLKERGFATIDEARGSSAR